MSNIYPTDDLRIARIDEVANPLTVCEELPITAKAAELTFRTRAAIHNILDGADERLLVIVGPCSIHDVHAAREYATRLALLRDELGDRLEIVMRVYFEKPRTTVGWKGLINDPGLDESFQINRGLRLARQLLLDVNSLGVPAGTEYLDLITPQYVADLISWGAIGARTTESQVHRELASGLSCPVGLKNGTDGNLQIAVDAVRAASRGHHFLSLTKAGHSAIYTTTGNGDCHIILRGGAKPNYDVASVEESARFLERAGLVPRIMIDCSHANSGKQHQQQISVGAAVAAQIAAGDRRIIGVMIESHLHAGRQDVVAGKPLQYGQSITDACINWDDTAKLLREIAGAVAERKNAPRCATVA
ncbi:MAG: 3-deoxy-7-phosphoheptulonate synthase [Gammaproteobacteria bacterium]|nr:3-deoxy-7-phosphoheptulonate synthase [Gammaproteobacteria bacterium]MDH3466419.1 3-deoxy-7-phosphoheptulonate synthase [Gammaproteobacteria bacterium]